MPIRLRQVPEQRTLDRCGVVGRLSSELFIGGRNDIAIGLQGVVAGRVATLIARADVDLTSLLLCDIEWSPERALGWSNLERSTYLTEVMVIIDVHAHYYPRDYLEAIGRTDMPSPVAAPLGGQSIIERLALMDAIGIDRQILSVSQAQPYLDDVISAVRAAALGNDLYEELCRQYPRRFSYFAVLPLPHIDESLAEIARVSDSAHVVGFTIGCSVNGYQLDDPIFNPIFAELDRRATALFLHPVGETDVAFLRDHNLVWSIGATFEDTAAALRLVYADVPSKFPSVKVIVPHLGGTLPFLIDRLTRKGSDATIAALRTFYYDSVSGSVDAFNCTCHAFGAERILFGTDYPFCDSGEFERHLTYMDASELDGDQLAMVRGARASHLLGIDRSVE
jgi:predicted TIM-barrel fold metal-dependent hydrolase